MYMTKYISTIAIAQSVSALIGIQDVGITL